MKKKILLPIILILVFLTSCNKYGFVNLNYPIYPQVKLPNEVKTIAVVNRSLTNTKDKKHKVSEAIKTAEVAGSDKIASDHCLMGVYDQINGVRGINIVIPSKTKIYGTGTRETPEILDWNLVRSICDSTKSDALLVLENFDSNSDLIVSTVTQQVTNVIQSGTVKPSLPNQIRVNVYSFWRLYHPATKTIIDQYQGNSNITIDGGLSGVAVPSPEVLTNAAYSAGNEYIQRFLPTYYTVRRDLYKRGKGSKKEEFKTAFRYAEVADWNGAIEKWKKIAKFSSKKNAGRACLNIAVGYEVLGNTDLAIEWAKKSYQEYNNKLGRNYSNILIRRKNVE